MVVALGPTHWVGRDSDPAGLRTAAASGPWSRGRLGAGSVLSWGTRRGSPKANPSGSVTPPSGHAMSCPPKGALPVLDWSPLVRPRHAPRGTCPLVPDRVGSEHRLTRCGQAGWSASGDRPVEALSCGRGANHPRGSWSRGGRVSTLARGPPKADPAGPVTCPGPGWLAAGGSPPGAIRRSVRLGLTPNPLGVLPLVAFGLGRAAPLGGAVLPP